MYIYCITNSINGKQYVGLTTRNIEESKSYYGSGVYINRSIKKYGKKNFKKEILELCNNDKQLKKQEIHWIQKLNTKAPNGYNLTDGGDGVLNPTEEVRTKISEKLKLLVGEKHPHWGMTRTDETKLKMRNAQLGIPVSLEAKKKISEKLSGRKLSKAICKKMSESKMGHSVSEHTRLKLKNQSSCVTVLQIDKITHLIINEYHSIQEASRKTNIAASGICKCCKGELKTAGKFI